MEQNNLIIERSILKIGVKNLNGRIYTMESAEKIVEQVNEKIDTMGCFFGELGHPSSFNISVKNISHNTKEVYIKDNILFGKFEILNVDKGNHLKNLLEVDPDSIVFRPRMSGRIYEDGTVSITKIFSFDAIPKDEDPFKEIL